MSNYLCPPFSSTSTVFASIERHAAATPDKAAVFCAGRGLTYRALADQVGCVAGALLRRGVKPGDRVAIETNNTVEHLIGTVGAMAAGAIAVALPADHTAYSATCEDAAPVLVLGTSHDSRLDNPVTPYPRVDISDLLATDKPPHRATLDRSVEPDEIAMLYYTSGTSSGVRKGVMQSYLQLHNTVHYISHVMQMDASISEFVASSVDNAFWFGRCRCVLHVGGTVLLSNGPLNPFGIVSGLKRHDGNAIAGDSAVFNLLLHHMGKHLVQLGSAIKWIKIASAPMALQDKRRLLELLPNARIVFNYGLTEAMRTCLNPLRDRPDKLESVGLPSPSVEVCIVDGSGRKINPGEVGEVLIRGGNLASGYWKKGEMWQARFHDDWYRSGDLGYIDPDGFVFLQGRIDHAINSGGKTIALSEVENGLRSFFTKTTFVACGMKDPKGILGEVVVLGIEGKWQEPTAWSELRIKMFEAIEPRMVPIAAYVVPQLPRTANLKVQLNSLRQAIEAGQCEAL
jgi:long-chain acyl-CoA synthetase